MINTLLFKKYGYVWIDKDDLIKNLELICNDKDLYKNGLYNKLPVYFPGQSIVFKTKQGKFERVFIEKEVGTRFICKEYYTREKYRLIIVKCNSIDKFQLPDSFLKMYYKTVKELNI